MRRRFSSKLLGCMRNQGLSPNKHHCRVQSTTINNSGLNENLPSIYRLPLDIRSSNPLSRHSRPLAVVASAYEKYASNDRRKSTQAVLERFYCDESRKEQICALLRQENRHCSVGQHLSFPSFFPLGPLGRSGGKQSNRIITL